MTDNFHIAHSWILSYPRDEWLLETGKEYTKQSCEKRTTPDDSVACESVASIQFVAICTGSRLRSNRSIAVKLKSGLWLSYLDSLLSKLL